MVKKGVGFFSVMLLVLTLAACSNVVNQTESSGIVEESSLESSGNVSEGNLESSENVSESSLESPEESTEVEKEDIPLRDTCGYRSFIPCDEL